MIIYPKILNCSVSNIHKIYTKKLSEMLTKAHRNQRMAMGRKFVNQYFAKGNEFLKHVVFGSEI